MNDEFNGMMDSATSAENSTQDQSCQRELALLKERYSYLMADFENHRRREEKERIAALYRAQASVLTELLPLVDDFERAFKDVATHGTQDAQKMTGFALIQKTLLRILEKHGVTEITHNEMFDPHFHEALLYVAQEGKPSGAIVDVLQKGYLLKGQVLRPAQVSVAK